MKKSPTFVLTLLLSSFRKLGDFFQVAFSKYLTIRRTLFCSDLIPNHLVLLFSFAVLQGCLLDAIHRCKKRPSMSHFLSKISLATSSGIIDPQGIPYYQRPSLLCKMFFHQIIFEIFPPTCIFTYKRQTKYPTHNVYSGPHHYLGH